MGTETMPERQPVYNWHAVHTAAKRHMINARKYMFDGGETIELSDQQGKQLLRATSYWGDIPAAEVAAKWLMQHTTVTIVDFLGEG